MPHWLSLASQMAMMLAVWHAARYVVLKIKARKQKVEPVSLLGKPKRDEAVIDSLNPMMMATEAPVGIGAAPKSVILRVVHRRNQWVKFDLNDQWWATSYMLLPVGYDFKPGGLTDELVKMKDPWYCGEVQ